MYDEACLWRTHQNYIRKNLQEIKDSLHTVHLPIKMQMRVGLWIRLSKQVEIKIGKKEKKKPSGLCQEEKKCRFLTQSKRETLLENLKRKAESKHSPRRFLTQICNTEYDAIQKSFLVHFHLFRNPKDCIRIEIIWQMMDNPPEERPATVPSPLSDIIRVHVVSVSEIMMTSDVFTFCLHRACFKWEHGYRKS